MRLFDAANTAVIAFSATSPCSCDGCFVDGRMSRVPELFAMATNRLCHGSFTTFNRAQFLVSRSSILRQPLPLYAMLLDTLLAPPGHFIHADAAVAKVPTGPGELDDSDPLFGRVINRLWSVLFGCASAGTAHCTHDIVLPVSF